MVGAAGSFGEGLGRTRQNSSSRRDQFGGTQLEPLKRLSL